MFCGNCGAEMLGDDKFCGVCGAPNPEAGTAAPAPPPRKQPAPPRQPAAPAAQQPPMKQPAAAPQGKPAAKTPAPKKEKPPKAPKPPKPEGGKKSSTMILMVVLFVVVAGAAGYYFMFMASPKDEPITPKIPAGMPPRPAGVTTAGPNFKAFADQLCALSKTNPMAIDDKYSYEFHARMSADPAYLEKSNYTMDEYIEFAIKDIKKKVAGQKFEKCGSCSIAKLDKMDCNDMYDRLSAVLSKEGIEYSAENISMAGNDMGVKDCALIILKQSWSGSQGEFPVAYFTGTVGGKIMILNYFYTDYFSGN